MRVTEFYASKFSMLPVIARLVYSLDDVQLATSLITWLSIVRV